MKKGLILLLLGGILLGTTSGVFAEELVAPAENSDKDTIQTDQQTEDTIDTSSTMVYPDSYPAGYYSYTTEASVDGASCYDLVEKVNALRVSLGRQPLVLDAVVFCQDLVQIKMRSLSSS